MRIWWILIITVHLVCGKSEIFKDINERDIKRETNINNDDQEEVENNLMINPEYNFTRRKRSLEGEERIKRQQKFHSWGGKRNTNKDEQEKVEDADETNNIEYDEIEIGNTHLINQSTPTNYAKGENIFSNVQGLVLSGPITHEYKREPEVIFDVSKRAQLSDSILQQFGFRPEMSEQNSKRYPAFNSWAGKRAFNSWGGKRASFNSWGGKRAAPFNSWGGKRNSAFNSWGGKRDAAFKSWGGKREAAFNSWGGKRASELNWRGKGKAAFNSWGGKRAAAFNSWGGKRAAPFNSWGGKRAAPFNSWGGKRTAAFNSWGGKRNLDDINNWGETVSVEDNNKVDQDKTYYEKNNFKDEIPDEQNYDTVNTMNYNEHINDKRGAAFNSWGGKRMPALESWAGKRIVAMNNPGGKKSAAFNSWGGKRATSTSFNSWGGKRSTSFNSLPGIKTPAISSDQEQDLPDNSEDVQDLSSHKMSDETLGDDHEAEFESTGVKSNNKLIHNLASYLHLVPDVDVEHQEVSNPGVENLWNNIKVENGFRDHQLNFGLPDNISEDKMEKRSSPAFSSWAGKRAPLFTPWYANKMPSLLISSGKRRPAFSSWGGKRSDIKPLQETDCSNSNECLDLESTKLIPSDEKQNINMLRKKREVNCSSEESIPGSGSAGLRICRDKKSDENFKKSRVMTRMLFQGGLSRPMAIKSLSRGLDFYAWGGKRSL